MTAEVQTAEPDEGPTSALVPTTTDDPYERAQTRLTALRNSFASVMSIAALMHRDEDWRFLTREDGTQYTSLSEVISDVMQVSTSMARRYVQAGRDFYLPLSEVTIEGTRIGITSGDVAALGSSGLADAVSTAKESLEGVDDPEEASAVIDDAVAQAKARKAAEKYSDDEWDSEGFDPPSSKRTAAEPAPVGSGATTAAEDADWNDGGEDDLSGLVPDPNAGEWQEEAPDASVIRGDLQEEDYDGPAPDDGGPEDEFDAVIHGGVDYLSSPEDMADLPPDVQEVVKAFGVLAEMDVESVVRAVTYDRRGALRPMAQAMAKSVRFRALAESQPWMIGAIGS